MKYESKVRVTYVAEYANELDAPGVSANMGCMGGKLVAVQFSDALLEADKDRKANEIIREAAQQVIDDEAMHEECDDEECLWCRLRRAIAMPEQDVER